MIFTRPKGLFRNMENDFQVPEKTTIFPSSYYSSEKIDLFFLFFFSFVFCTNPAFLDKDEDFLQMATYQVLGERRS